MNSKSKTSGASAARSKTSNKPGKTKVAGKGAQGEAWLFKDQSAWSAWLDKNHRNSTGIWVRLAKKNSGLQSITYAEALEVALCYGWIDGQKKPESEQAWLQRFCPRSRKSIWSK